MSGVKAEQGNDLESTVNTRQDMNIIVSGGGDLTWVQSTAVVGWTSDIKIYVGGLSGGGVLTITVSTVDIKTGAGAAGDTLYIDLDRSTGATVSMNPSGDKAVTDASFDSSTRIMLGVVGTDLKFYWRNGTVVEDGATVQFGGVRQSIDREEITTDTAVAGEGLNGIFDLQSITYTAAVNQLAVYVGGILQIGGAVDYVETDLDTVTFEVGSRPTTGERVTFVVLAGAQGATGTSATLQQAFDNGGTIDVVAGSPILLERNNAATTAVVQVGDGTTVQVEIYKDGTIRILGGSGAGLELEDAVTGNLWGAVPDKTVAADTDGLLWLYDVGGTPPLDGIRFDEAGFMEWGQYTGSAYPAGSWAGDGAMRWQVFTGTLPAAPLASRITLTTATNVIGILFMVEGSNGSPVIAEMFSAQISAEEFNLEWVTPNIDIVSPGAGLANAPYTLIIFTEP